MTSEDKLGISFDLIVLVCETDEFFGYNSVDYNFKITVVDQDCTNVGKFILKSRFQTDH